MAENDIEALAAKLVTQAEKAARTEADIQYYSGGSKQNVEAEKLAELVAQNLHTILTALRSTTAEPVRSSEFLHERVTPAWRWTVEPYEEHGGYDCMTGAIQVGPITLDGKDYGQEQCKAINPEALEQMTADAKSIAFCMSNLVALTHPTGSAAKDAEIATYREALEKIERTPAWGYPDRWETTPAEVRQLARAALANRGEAGALAKERGE